MTRNGITLHPQHGVNPTLGVCFWCGEQDGTIGLLGYNRGKEAPRQAILSLEPCEKCKAGMAQGITLIEATPYAREAGAPALRDGVYPTGRWCVLKEEAVERIFSGAPVLADMKRTRKALLEPEVYGRLIGSAP